MSNSLDPDQARHYVGPDLGPYCLQTLSAIEDTSRQRVIYSADLGEIPYFAGSTLITNRNCLGQFPGIRPEMYIGLDKHNF